MIVALLLPAGAAPDTEDASDAASQNESPQPSLEIRKVYFMFHPVCWQMHGSERLPVPTGPTGLDVSIENVASTQNKNSS